MGNKNCASVCGRSDNNIAPPKRNKKGINDSELASVTTERAQSTNSRQDPSWNVIETGIKFNGNKPEWKQPAWDTNSPKQKKRSLSSDEKKNVMKTNTAPLTVTPKP